MNAYTDLSCLQGRKVIRMRVRDSAYQRKAPSALHMLLVLVRAHGGHNVVHAAHVSHKQPHLTQAHQLRQHQDMWLCRNQYSLCAQQTRQSACQLLACIHSRLWQVKLPITCKSWGQSTSSSLHDSLATASRASSTSKGPSLAARNAASAPSTCTTQCGCLQMTLIWPRYFKPSAVH